MLQADNVGMTDTAMDRTSAGKTSASGKHREKPARGEDVGPKLLPMKVRAAASAVGGQANLAEWVGVARSQPTRWAAGETEPSTAVARAVTDLEFIASRARMVWSDSVLPDWLNGHNAFLDGATPLEMIRQGRTSEVLDAITGDEAGVYA